MGTHFGAKYGNTSSEYLVFWPQKANIASQL